MKRSSPNVGSPEDIVAAAKQRLSATKSSPVAMKHVERLKSQYSLPDDAVLGLRLLTPMQLQRFVAAEERHVTSRLSAAPPARRGEVLLPFISKLDASVAGMLRTLLDLDSQGAELPSQPQSQQDGDDVITKAQARLKTVKPFAIRNKMEKLQKDFCLGDEILLAMRMLHIPDLNELFAGEAHVRERLSAEEDPSALMMWLISQLDPQVEMLVSKIVDLDGSAATSPRGPATTTRLVASVQPKAGGSIAKPVRPKIAPPILKPTPPTTAPPISKPSTVGKGMQTLGGLPPCGSPRWAPVIKRVYEKYNAEKLSELASILAKYKGVEDDLYKALAKKYGFPADKLLPEANASSPAERKRKLDAVEASVSSPAERKRKLDVVESEVDGVDGDVFAAAQERLHKNKTTMQAGALAKLKAGNSFSDEILLALRLLPTDRLRELAGRKEQLQQQLNSSVDKNQCMMSMIWAIDPDVQTMVHKLVEMDKEASATPATSQAASHNRNSAVGGPKPPGVPPPAKRGIVPPAARPTALRPPSRPIYFGKQ